MYSYFSRKCFSTTLGKRVGFIGLGNMGLPMVQNLIKHGYKVTAFDINAKGKSDCNQPDLFQKMLINGHYTDCLVDLNVLMKELGVEGYEIGWLKEFEMSG